jgi:hypothetical protein
MLLELGIGASVLGGLWFARKTKPVKFVKNTITGWWTKTRLGQSVILSNAKESIKNEYNREREKLREDQLEISIDLKGLDKKEEYIRFLQFALEDDSVSTEEKTEYKKELETKQGELEVLKEALKQKQSLIENREKALDSYESNVLDKRLSEAELAEVVFKQQQQVEKYERELENVDTLGDSSLTNSVISRYTGTHTGSKIKVARRYELLDKFRKNQEDNNS